MKKTYSKPQATIEELQKMLSEANERLEKANEELKVRDRERTALFANLSHDLRAPLAVISGAAEVLSLDAEPGTQAAEMIGMITERTALMKSIVEDMAFLAGLESSTRKHDLKDADLGDFLEKYFSSLKADPGWSSRELCLEIPDDFRAAVRMDPELITRVLDNLLTNAKKYTGEGSRVVISVTGEPGDAEDMQKVREAREVIVSVRDNGPGIAPEDLPHIFERTFRASRERTPEDGSSGLGLSIAREIVESMGGRIGCESSRGEGSRFYFSLLGK